MATSLEHDHAATSGRRGFTVLSLAAGAVVAMLLLVLANADIGAMAEPTVSASRAAPPPVAVEPPAASAERQAPRLDDGVDWRQVEVWSEFAAAAVAAYEN